MRVETFSCDNCGKLMSGDRDAPYWLMLRAADTALVEPNGPCGVLILKWLEGVAELQDAHACGQPCAFAMVTRYLAAGRLEKEAR